jgi:small subunit ribosomal protein S9
MAELVQYYGTGRRKRAIARVYLRPGSGEFKVNGRAFEEYFVTPAQRSAAKAPLALTDSAAAFNIVANVLGGGVRGQADAVKLGIARALMQFNASSASGNCSVGSKTKIPQPLAFARGSE